MSEPWQHYYQSQRLKLSYWTWGEASKPPLVLVHGGRDHARNWDRVAEAFRDDYHVVACDLRGHGDSEWAVGGYYALADHIGDLVTLIDLVGGHAPVIAHSFGGSVTLLAAGVFPEKFDKIVDIEGANTRMERRPEITPQYLRDWVMRTRAVDSQSPRVYPSFRAAADRMREANPQLTPEMADHLARWGANAIDNGWVWKFDPRVRSRTPVEMRPEDVERIWATVPCPILHLVGENSQAKRESFKKHPPEAYFKDARTQVIPDAGHWLHHDQLELTLEAIRDFLGPPPPAEVEE